MACIRENPMDQHTEKLSTPANKYLSCNATVVSIEELLVECLEALVYDAGSREKHLCLIEKSLITHDNNEGIQSALALLKARLALHRPDNIWGMFQTTEEHAAFQSAIIHRVLPLKIPKYLYHGTTVGRLKGIAKNGLIPGKVPVWKGQSVKDSEIRKNSNSGVFFANNWRAAMHNWAYIAHLRSRGPRDSLGRKPTVIRISAEKINLVVDPLAAAPSLMVKGSVLEKGVEVAIGFDVDFPKWVPLELVAASLNS